MNINIFRIHLETVKCDCGSGQDPHFPKVLIKWSNPQGITESSRSDDTTRTSAATRLKIPERATTCSSGVLR